MLQVPEASKKTPTERGSIKTCTQTLQFSCMARAPSHTWKTKPKYTSADTSSLIYCRPWAPGTLNLKVGCRAWSIGTRRSSPSLSRLASKTTWGVIMCALSRKVDPGKKSSSGTPVILWSCGLPIPKNKNKMLPCYLFVFRILSWGTGLRSVPIWYPDLKMLQQPIWNSDSKDQAFTNWAIMGKMCIKSS